VSQQFTRKCPSCDTVIAYKTRAILMKAARNNALCKICSKSKPRNTQLPPEPLKRKCPSCKGDIQYTSERGCIQAERLNVRCRRCADDAVRVKTRTPEHCKLKSEQTAALWNEGTLNWSNFKKRSEFEIALGEELKKEGWVTDHVIAGSCPDFYHPELDVIVEYFGDFWHCHPSCDKRIYELYEGFHPRSGLTPQAHRSKDARRLAKFRAHHRKVVVIWEHEVKEHNVHELIQQRVFG
jgi:G:T-mismatch repair DNA endonuclease (very short patch repair protein)